MSINVIADAFTLVMALMISLSFHEFAHAYAAKRLGDRTAELAGRLTINPLPHVDPMGTVILPLSLALLGVPALFGWAKPVPVNVRDLRNQKWGYVIVSAAGPLANLLLCLLAVIVLNVYHLYLSAQIPDGHFLFPIIKLTQKMVVLNAFLAIFNLIPLPPLDGGSILPAFLPAGPREFFEDYITPYGSFFLIALIISGGLSWIQPVAFAYVGLAQFFAETLL